MTRVAYFVGCALLVASPLIADAQVDDQRELFLNDDVERGVFENGVAYYVQANDIPKGVIDLRLVVKFGSAYEEQNERGLAHFIEHMGFNGTERYPGNQIIAELELLGVKFGPDLNAYTSFDETVYTLQITDSDQEEIETALHILQQWAFAMEFDDEEIRKERGVVLEEARIRNSATQRVANQHINTLFEGSRYVDQLPIGRTEVIRGASIADIRALYNKWYHPERMALIAVGDINDTERFIETAARIFAPPLPADRELERIDLLSAREEELAEYRLHNDIDISVAYDPEISNERAVIYLKRPTEQETTVLQYRKSLEFALLSLLLNQRFQDISDRANSALNGARLSFGFYTLNHAIDIATLSINFARQRAREAIEIALTEVRRIAEQGVSEEEYRLARQQLVRLYEQYRAESATRDSEFFSRAYTRHFLYGELLLDVEEEFALAERLIEDIAAESLAGYARELFEGENRFFSFTGIGDANGNNSGDVVDNNGDDGDRASENRFDSDDLLEIFAAVQAKDLDDSAIAPIPTIEQPQCIIDATALEAADARSYLYDEALDLHYWSYTNGIEVILRENDFNQDVVNFNMYSRGGASLYDDEEYADAISAAEIIATAGLHEQTPSELRRYLSDKQITITPYIRQFAEGMEGSFSIADIDSFGQLFYAYFTSPRFDEVQFENWRTRRIERLINEENDPLTRFAIRQQQLLTTSHPRALPLTAAQVEEIDMDNAYSIYKERFLEKGAADFTLLFVGNITPTELDAVLAPYIANLPASEQALPVAADSAERSRSPRALLSLSPEEWERYRREYPASPQSELLPIGVGDRGIANILYHGDYEWGLEENAAFSAFADYLDLVLNQRIREKNSAVYTIGAGVNNARFPDDRFILNIFFGSDPDQIENIIEDIEEIIAELRATPPTAEEVARIQETQRSEFVRRRQTNEYWISLLRLSDLYQFDLKEALNRLERINALTADKITGVAQKYLSDERRITLILLPREEEQRENDSQE